ncbi:MAG: hypothetical protein IJ840_08075 [Bacteroidales bacterium]|nr:hypothetical protein [Bacteroidales bacterium]
MEKRNQQTDRRPAYAAPEMEEINVVIPPIMDLSTGSTGNDWTEEEG